MAPWMRSRIGRSILRSDSGLLPPEVDFDLFPAEVRPLLKGVHQFLVSSGAVHDSGGTAIPFDHDRLAAGKLHDFREQTCESMTPGPPGPVLAGALSCWRRFRSGPYTPFLPSHPGWCRAV